MPAQILEISSSNISCALSSLGASIASVRVPNARGTFTEVALPAKSLETGEGDPSLAGRTIGPCCGRVRDGVITIGNKKYQLTQNEGRNHLHGGEHGCAISCWSLEEVTPARVRFVLRLPDGLDGYPGNRALSAEYTVEGNTLRVAYTATTDRPTWLDLTNHVYWDLSGRFDGSVMDQVLEVAAKKVVHNDEAHLPVAIVDADEAMDFSVPCALSGKLADHLDHPQLRNARGFNNAYVLDPALARAMGGAARLYDPGSGIRMTMTTDQPAVVLYSGGYLGADTKLRAAPGAAAPGCAIALEAQGLPDPFHMPGAKASLLSPGETYRRNIRWRFD
ncbi:MAG: galactose mutarotase [Clostridia bacterium]|nr:galactose mutarotase [Clostridia bacterium]